MRILHDPVDHVTINRLNRPDEPAGPFFAEHGFYVLHHALSPAEVDEANDEAVAICRGQRGTFPGLLEHDADMPDGEVLRDYLCIHLPHKISQFMEGLLHHAGIVDVLTQAIGPDVKAMQSMLFIKASGKPGQAWHQDEYFIPTRDRSLLGAWIALDDATVENGCLWVLPGSHRHGVIFKAEEHDDNRFDCASEAQDFPYTDDDAIPVEVKRGSVVFFNGYLLHRSLPNQAPAGTFRRALVNHYMSAASLLPWYGYDKQIPTQVGAADDRDIVLVAGRDPYAYKGIQHRHSAHVRPSGEGGCSRGGDAPKKQESKAELEAVGAA